MYSISAASVQPPQCGFLIVNFGVAHPRFPSYRKLPETWNRNDRASAVRSREYRIDSGGRSFNISFAILDNSFYEIERVLEGAAFEHGNVRVLSAFGIT
jgi:hypothetical protein